MGVSRRDFLKISGTTALLGSIGVNLDPARAHARELRIKNARQSTTICPYCSVGCGLIVHTENGKVINAEGDPDHPISEGTLCSKGASLLQIVNNEKRVKKPMYREPGGTAWKEVEWDWALDKIARNIKDSRDRTFKDVVNGQVVNRTDGIAHVGSAALDNEECYLIQKLVRSWGLVYVEHQARI